MGTHGKPIPTTSNLTEIKPDNPDAMVRIVTLDMDAYATKYGRE